ncbi:GntR family transcriptional regulator [Georgenia halophila]|uniref:GntR family transcriptional regulator n=1 Tax=Georgenia halophila TaxID=620889 RepID=A0ABP8LKN4_9MICO
MDPIVIDAASATPPYEQVRAQLAGQITAGTLVVGTRLPTVRGLAGDLGLAVNTVARSYRQLEEAGLVETRGRAGTVVSSAGVHALDVAEAAARRYAETVRGVGLDREQSLQIVRTALEA